MLVARHGPAILGQTKTHRRRPTVGSRNRVACYLFDLPPPAGCARATRRRRAARCGIQFGLAMESFISLKIVPAL